MDGELKVAYLNTRRAILGVFEELPNGYYRVHEPVMMYLRHYIYRNEFLKFHHCFTNGLNAMLGQKEGMSPIVIPTSSFMILPYPVNDEKLTARYLSVVNLAAQCSNPPKDKILQ